MQQPKTSSATVSDTAGSPRRGRPRSERSRRAILSAAGELMLERGLSEISMDAVAERAAVSKATIYRWWPSKELLVLDALLSEWGVGTPDGVDTGSLGGDLRALVLPWIRQLTARPYGRVISALIAGAQTDAGFAEEYRAHFVALRREPARVVFQRACERGDIPAGTNIDAALDLLYGPFYHRLLHGHAPLTESFARTIVDYVVAAVSSREEVRR
jgi:AcrR family transcriptional regulator